MGRTWEEVNCLYYEEAVNYLNIDLPARVVRNGKIPMVAGERIYTRRGYRQYFEKQTPDVIQPDLALLGGITEGKKICDYASIYGFTVQMHVCGSPIVTAAVIQLESVILEYYHPRTTYQCI